MAVEAEEAAQDAMEVLARSVVLHTDKVVSPADVPQATNGLARYEYTKYYTTVYNTQEVLRSYHIKVLRFTTLFVSLFSAFIIRSLLLLNKN